jgi:transcription antitermination factor NusB
MKTSADPRHLRRQQLIQELFKFDFHSQPTTVETKQILTHKASLDSVISKAAPEYPIEKINRVDLAILRLAVYELTIQKTAPVSVIIDEAVELAKEFGGTKSPAFINGALGNITNEYSDISK